MGRYKPDFKQDQYRNKILFTLYSNVYERIQGSPTDGTVPGSVAQALEVSNVFKAGAFDNLQASLFLLWPPLSTVPLFLGLLLSSFHPPGCSCPRALHQLSLYSSPPPSSLH